MQLGHGRIDVVVLQQKLRCRLISGVEPEAEGRKLALMRLEEERDVAA